jgi:hypothetical protein
MIQKRIIIILLTLISIVNGNNQYPNCRQYENKIYRLKFTFSDSEPAYSTLRLNSFGGFDELSNIANGNNKAELGESFAFSSRVGYYKCLRGNDMRLTSIGYLYKTEDVEFLKVNGATVVVDYYLRFTNSGKKFTGSVKFVAFESGTDPFKTNDEPAYESKVGKVQGELLKFRSYSNLS